MPRSFRGSHGHGGRDRERERERERDRERERERERDRDRERDRGRKRDSFGSVLGSDTFVKLFVGSVPRNISEEQVRPMFAEHGTVLEVALIKDRRSGQQQGCCFVKYASRDEAERAIRFLNNQRFLPGGNAPVQVRYADGERERLGKSYAPSMSMGISRNGTTLGAVEHKLFVGCLNKEASEREIQEIFLPYGRVDDIYIMRDDHKQSRGCAFVKFLSREAALSAIKGLNNCYVMRGCDQPLAVRFADPKRPKASEGRGGSGYSRVGSGSGFSSSRSGRSSPVDWRSDEDSRGSQPSFHHYGGRLSPPRSNGHVHSVPVHAGSTNGMSSRQLISEAPLQGQLLIPAGVLQQFPQLRAQQQQVLLQPAAPPPPPPEQAAPPHALMHVSAQQPLATGPQAQQSLTHLQPAFQQFSALQQPPPPPNPFQAFLQQHLQAQALSFQQANAQQQSAAAPPRPPSQQPWMLPQATVASPTPLAPVAATNWTEHVSPEGLKYYYNSATAESKWEKPDELLKLEQPSVQGFNFPFSLEQFRA